MSSSSSMSTSLGGYSLEDFSEPSVAIVGVISASKTRIHRVNAHGRATNLVMEQAKSDLPLWSVMIG